MIQTCCALVSDFAVLLAAVHRVEFPASGDFDADFNIQHGLRDFVPAIRHETARCLKGEKLKARLSPSEQEKVALFIEENAFLSNSLVQARLTHSDFDQKNILVDKVAEKGKSSPASKREKDRS